MPAWKNIGDTHTKFILLSSVELWFAFKILLPLTSTVEIPNKYLVRSHHAFQDMSKMSKVPDNKAIPVK